MSDSVPKNILNILIIDDDKIDREAVRRYLRKPGMEMRFFEADTGAMAEKYLQEYVFDCIFLDYNMPDMDGISFLRRFYNLETGLAPAPTVMLTGKGSESVMIDALRWGVQDYLVKNDISSDVLHIAMAKAREIFGLKKSQQQAMEILRQSQKMEAVGQLTSGIAHDFNNILTIILGNTRMQRRLLSDSVGHDFSREDMEKKIEAIESSVRKGTDLVRRLMVFTRQRPPESIIANINDHVDNIHELLKRTLGDGVLMRTEFSADLWPVRIDVGQFENALINLAVNARDAMPDGGHLTIETKNVKVDENYVFKNPDMNAGEYVMVAVSDTGVGMSPEVSKRIFEPFYTTKKVGEGTGLGLSMVYGMLKQANSHIHVYSEKDHGSVFRIYIPRSGEADSLSAGEEDFPGGDETILVVDDNERVRMVGATILERLGYKVLQADGGRTALEILKHTHAQISLLFTDVIMANDVGGMDLARKAREYYPHIRVLFTSGYTESTLPHYELAEGQEIIGKPYSKKDLAEKVRKVLDGSK